MAKRILNVERIVALASDPAGAEGGLYYNSVTKVLRYHNGVSWSDLGGSGTTGQFTGDTPPVSPALGDIWFDTSTGKTYVYYDSFWIEVGTSEGGRPLVLSGDVTGTGTDNIATTLGPSGVGAGTYGSTSAIPVITVDVKGRVTAASVANISTTLVGLADVQTTTLADNEILSYNFGTSKWVNQGLNAAILEVDGAGSNIDADLLDGQQGTYYTTAGNLTGTIPSAVLGNSTVFIGTTGVALNRGTGALTLAGITLTSPTFTGTVTTPLTTAGYVTTTAGGVLGSVATIPNAGLTNSAVTVGTTAIALGTSSTTLAGLTSVTSTTFVGALTGNASSATNATNTGITEDVATATAVYPTWVTANTGNLPQKTTSTRLSFVPSTGVLTATTFSGAHSGSGAGLTGIPQSGVTSLTTDLALKAPLASPTFTGTVTTPLTVAGYVTTTAGGVLGSVATIPNAGLTNSSVTIGSTAVALGATVTTFAGLTSVTSTTFVGALTGNASSATNATNTGITDDTTTAATMYPTWVTAATGNLPQKTTSTKLTFNPSTGTLSATTFSGAHSGSGAGLTGIPNAALTNSSVTVNGTAIALGASGTVTAAAGTLTGATLNATVTGSSLTSVGTITSGIWNAGAVTSSGAGVFTSTISASGLAGSLLSAASPLINGTAAAGTSAIPSRQDHVHPTDTSRAPLAAPTFTTSAAVTGGSLGTTLASELIPLSLNTLSSNGDYLRSKLTRTTAGTDWTTAQWKLQRRVDATDMGYIAFGSTAALDVRIGSNVTDIAVFATTQVTLNQNLSVTGTVTATSTVAGSGLAGSLLSAATPLVNGTASAGTSAIPSRQDHVHGTDTTRAPLASPTFTGTVSAPKYVATGAQTLAEYRMRNFYVSTTDPGTGNDGDIWLKY